MVTSVYESPIDGDPLRSKSPTAALNELDPILPSYPMPTPPTLKPPLALIVPPESTTVTVEPSDSSSIKSLPPPVPLTQLVEVLKSFMHNSIESEMIAYAGVWVSANTMPTSIANLKRLTIVNRFTWFSPSL